MDSATTKLEPTLANIGREVCRAFEVERADIMGPHRERHFARIRHAAFFLARKYTVKSIPTIGRYFNRDHTTIIYGIKRVNDWLAYDPAYAAKVAELDALFAPIIANEWPEEKPCVVEDWPEENHENP